MIALRAIISLAALALGASALVLDPMHNLERGLEVSAHRRHAANVLELRSPSPEQRIRQRRSLRQKRCAQRQQDASTTTASAAVTLSAQGDVPLNVAPAPTTSTPAAQDTPPADSGNNDNNSGSSSTSNNGGGADTYSGDLTFYDVGLGACGGTNTDADMIAAASMLLYDGFDGYTGANPNNNPICGKQASITYGGNTIVVTIVDRCVGCDTYALDLSPTAFSMLADQSLGRLHGATWHFL